MADEDKKQWYYRNPANGNEEGPCELLELAGLLKTGDITGDTPDHYGDLNQWLVRILYNLHH